MAGREESWGAAGLRRYRARLLYDGAALLHRRGVVNVHGAPYARRSRDPSVQLRNANATGVATHALLGQLPSGPDWQRAIARKVRAATRGLS